MKKEKGLAQLKRDLKVGTQVKMTIFRGQKKGSLIGIKRYVVKKQTNAVAFSEDKDKTTGSFLYFPKASLIEYKGNTFRIYNAGKRDLTETEKKIKENEPNDYYGKRRYYNEHTKYRYLAGWEKARGKRYKMSENKIYDDKIKGDLAFEYKIILK